MNCFECAKANDTVPAVAICRECGVGLCLEHLSETARYGVGGRHEGCGHTVAGRRPLADLPGARLTPDVA